MEYNDYELVSLAQENNEDAINILHEKYKKIIYVKSKNAYKLLKKKGIELSDVIQEATIGFEEAIKDYNQDDKAIFYTFANMCIDRQIKSLIVKLCRNKYKILNDAITLDNDEEMDLYNLLTDDVTPEKELFNREDASQLYNKIKETLTDFEDCVFELKIQGFSYSEINEVLDTSSKEVYNAVDRIRKKVNKILNK